MMESNSQNALPTNSAASLDSTARTGDANAVDWQEDVYQKVKTMKEMYYNDLSAMHQKISMKLQQRDSLPQQPKIAQIEKLRIFKNMLEKLMQILQMTKNNFLLSHREKLPQFEKQIIGLLNTNRPSQPVHPMQPGQILPPASQQSHSKISLSQQQNMTDQLKRFQSQRGPSEAPSSSLDSTTQTRDVNAVDWQEEVYQKVKTMKEMYYTDLSAMHHKISMKLQQHDSLPQQPKIAQIEKLRIFKNMLEKLMQILQITKNNILLSHSGKLPQFEKQIIGLLNTNRPSQPVHPMQPGQILPPVSQQSHSQISLSQQQNMTDQLKRLQSQRGPSEAPSSSLDSTTQTRDANAVDWQEEVYQKIKTMKEMYYNDLSEVHQKISMKIYYLDLSEMHQKSSMKLQQHDSLPQPPKTAQIEKLQMFQNMLEKLMQVLQISKNNILHSHREKLPQFEKQIIGLVNINRPRRSV